MKFRILLVAVCVFALALPALAQGLDGKWAATVTTQRGDQTTTFEFKVAGGAVTGTVTAGGRGGPQEIKNGKLDGMKLSFETSQAGRGGGDPVTISWTGTLAGDSLKLTRGAAAGGRGGPQEMEAKRVK